MIEDELWYCPHGKAYAIRCGWTCEAGVKSEGFFTKEQYDSIQADIEKNRILDSAEYEYLRLKRLREEQQMRKGYEPDECYNCNRIMDDMREHIGGAWFCEYCAEYQKTTGDLSMKIQRVRELHKPVNGPYDDSMCAHCFVDDHKYYEYPCPTIKALDGEIK